MRECLHCHHEGSDDIFAHYRDGKGALRPRNVCLGCHRELAALRQARYKERHLEAVRETQRNRKYLRYHSDPDFRAKCVEQSKGT